MDASALDAANAELAVVNSELKTTQLALEKKERELEDATSGYDAERSEAWRRRWPR